VIEEAWSPWIQGSPVFIWEQKLKATKKAIQEWVKVKTTQERKDIQDLTEQMEEIRAKMEVDPVSPSLLMEEQMHFPKASEGSEGRRSRLETKVSQPLA
jgi:hypothetical protein